MLTAIHKYLSLTMVGRNSIVSFSPCKEMLLRKCYELPYTSPFENSFFCYGVFGPDIIPVGLSLKKKKFSEP